ncbi:hypothetical protein [Tahibacter amnicola]|uniref:Uncharacterized protein n=1 Tax=Tahibacter amnicola TaxID=2976241 RepID=A0ABY6B8Q7_9GAMM|nr:hypothetical protein [Tahibacter amnicola]UXI66255.1 hypothetical protein N4264_16020 [Tahibacter amnicola]
MCNLVYLSTTSLEDLALCNTDKMVFTHELPGRPAEAQLRHPYRWYVGSSAGCSCEFRHVMAENVEGLGGFGTPEPWYEEAPAVLEATQQVIRVIRRLVEAGESVDCIDLWDDQHSNGITHDLPVDLDVVDDPAFRFFEGYRFEFCRGPGEMA